MVIPRLYLDSFWRGDVEDRVFVARPFNERFEAIHESILRPAVESVGLSAFAVNASRISNSIMSEILEGIAHSKLVLADISSIGKVEGRSVRNANVLYEVGIAHAILQPEEVILIRNDREKLQFDISGIRILEYNEHDHADSIELITILVRDALDSTEQAKRLRVIEAAESVDNLLIRHLLGYRAEGRGLNFHIPWDSGDTPAALTQVMTVRRALELRLVRLETAATPSEGKLHYSYHWTPFGEAVWDYLVTEKGLVDDLGT